MNPVTESQPWVNWVSYAIIASASWTIEIYNLIHLSRKDQKDWKKTGLSDDLIVTMTEKRGALSRFRILKTLESPQYKGRISDVTDIDWREVTREVDVLRGLGLVQSTGKKSNMEMYELTGKGRT